VITFEKIPERAYEAGNRYAVLRDGSKIGEVYRLRHSPQSRPGKRDHIAHGYFAWHRDTGAVGIQEHRLPASRCRLTLSDCELSLIEFDRRRARAKV
jgi:hypothetical protein